VWLVSVLDSGSILCVFVFFVFFGSAVLNFSIWGVKSALVTMWEGRTFEFKGNPNKRGQGMLILLLKKRKTQKLPNKAN
jgi:hypothetical protein